MLNEDKIELMTSIALFEKREGKQLAAAGKMFKRDFVGSHMLHGFLRFTAAYLLAVGVWALCSVEQLLSAVSLNEITGFGISLLVWYVGGLTVYELITRKVYGKKYDESRRTVQVYSAKLKRLKKRYDSQGKTKEMTKEGVHHDGASGV